MPKNKRRSTGALPAAKRPGLRSSTVINPPKFLEIPVECQLEIAERMTLPTLCTFAGVSNHACAVARRAFKHFKWTTLNYGGIRSCKPDEIYTECKTIFVQVLRYFGDLLPTVKLGLNSSKMNAQVWPMLQARCGLALKKLHLMGFVKFSQGELDTIFANLTELRVLVERAISLPLPMHVCQNLEVAEFLDTQKINEVWNYSYPRLHKFVALAERTEGRIANFIHRHQRLTDVTVPKISTSIASALLELPELRRLTINRFNPKSRDSRRLRALRHLTYLKLMGTFWTSGISRNFTGARNTLEEIRITYEPEQTPDWDELVSFKALRRIRMNFSYYSELPADLEHFLNRTASNRIEYIKVYWPPRSDRFRRSAFTAVDQLCKSKNVALLIRLTQRIPNGWHNVNDYMMRQFDENKDGYLKADLGARRHKL